MHTAVHRTAECVPVLLIALNGLTAGCSATPAAVEPPSASAAGPNLDPRVPRAPASVTAAQPGTQPYDRDVWQTLLHHHDTIRREVRRIPDGLEATTESDDPFVATLIQDHALAMKHRIEHGRRVRTWDPVFRELFDRHRHVRLEVELTEKGVRIVETTQDPVTLRLLKSHSAGVTDMVREGGAAARRETPYVDD